MKKVVFLLLLFVTRFGFSQTDNEYNYWSRLKSDFFWSDYEVGFYVGPTVGIEKFGVSVGGELKFYGAYYMPLGSISFYGNYRRGLQTYRHNIPQNVIGFGAHIGIFGLEVSSHFGDKPPLYKLTPKLGFDWGNVSIFYGYDINLTKRKIPAYMNHSITLKYSVYFPVR